MLIFVVGEFKAVTLTSLTRVYESHSESTVCWYTCIHVCMYMHGYIYTTYAYKWKENHTREVGGGWAGRNLTLYKFINFPTLFMSDPFVSLYTSTYTFKIWVRFNIGVSYLLIFFCLFFVVHSLVFVFIHLFKYMYFYHSYKINIF